MKISDEEKIKIISKIPNRAIDRYRIVGDNEYYAEKLIVSLHFELDYTIENKKILEKILRDK